MVVAAVILALMEDARPSIQITAIGEISTIRYKETFFSNVKDDFFSLGIVRVLNEFKRHYVIALQTFQV